MSGPLLVDVGSREDSQVPQKGSDIQRTGSYRPGDPRVPKQEGLEALSPAWGGGWQPTALPTVLSTLLTFQRGEAEN